MHADYIADTTINVGDISNHGSGDGIVRHSPIASCMEALLKIWNTCMYRYMYRYTYLATNGGVWSEVYQLGPKAGTSSLFANAFFKNDNFTKTVSRYPICMSRQIVGYLALSATVGEQTLCIKTVIRRRCHHRHPHLKYLQAHLSPGVSWQSRVRGQFALLCPHDAGH